MKIKFIMILLAIMHFNACKAPGSDQLPMGGVSGQSTEIGGCNDWREFPGSPQFSAITDKNQG